MTTSEETLRRLAIGDPVYCRALMAPGPGDISDELDARSVALLRLAASITAGSAGPIWQQRVRDALDAGLGFDEVVGSLVVLAPMVGLDRIVAIAPDLARALGYDIDAALEELDSPVRRRADMIGDASERSATRPAGPPAAPVAAPPVVGVPDL